MIRIGKLSARIIARFWAYVDKRGPDECWPWLGNCSDKGYGRFKLVGRTNVRATRVAYTIASGIDPGDDLVCHTCDNPPCCNPKHLWAGTNADNMADMAAKGRSNTPPAKRAENGNAKLTEYDVIQIKLLILDGLTNRTIGNFFGVSHHAISCIRRGKSWGAVPLTLPYQSASGDRSPI